MVYGILNWRKALQNAVSVYSMVSHRATGFSPFMMMYECEIILPKKSSSLDMNATVIIK